MFLTPRMPASDPFATASSATASSAVPAAFEVHQGGSQRGTMGRPPVSPLGENRSYYRGEATSHTASLSRLPGRWNVRDANRPVPVCPPTHTMAVPAAHDAYYEPRPSMIMRELPHRPPDRRDRRVIGRASPYARSSATRPHAANDAHSSPQYHHFPRDDSLDLLADSMFPPDVPYHHAQHASRVPAPGAPRLHQSTNRSVHEAFYEEAQPHSHYTAPFHVAQRDEGGLHGMPTYQAAHVDDWRDYRPEVVASGQAPWAYAPPPPLPVENPRSPSATADIASPPPAPVADAALAPDLTLVGQLCAKRNCYRQACPLYGDFCEFHKPSRLCKVPECRKCAKTGGYCIAHGGGRRCQAHGCTKSAKEGGRCIAHGGGKRCQAAGCDKAATAGGLCAAHA